MEFQKNFGFGDKLLIKVFLAHTLFISREEQDSDSLWVKSKCDSQGLALGIRTQFFEVGIFGTAERVRMGATKPRAK